MLISVLAIAPRVYVYTRIGRELFNPFTRMFVILLMIIIAFSGLGIFVANLVFYLTRKKEEKNASPQDDIQVQAKADEVEALPDEKEPYIPIIPEDLVELEGAEFSDIQKLRKKFKRRER